MTPALLYESRSELDYLFILGDTHTHGGSMSSSVVAQQEFCGFVSSRNTVMAKVL